MDWLTRANLDPKVRSAIQERIIAQLGKRATYLVPREAEPRSLSSETLVALVSSLGRSYRNDHGIVEEVVLEAKKYAEVYVEHIFFNWTYHKNNQRIDHKNEVTWSPNLTSIGLYKMLDVKWLVEDFVVNILAQRIAENLSSENAADTGRIINELRTDVNNLICRQLSYIVVEDEEVMTPST